MSLVELVITPGVVTYEQTLGFMVLPYLCFHRLSSVGARDNCQPEIKFAQTQWDEVQT